MRLNAILAAFFLVSVAAHFLVQPVSSIPNFEFIPEMVRTSAYKAYAANPNFPNGRTLQLPPAGTAPRGMREVNYRPGEAEALRAGSELSNPFSAEDIDAAARGSEVFRIYCGPCHGASGRGDGPVAMRGFPAPPPLNSEKALAMKDGQIFHLISFGQKNMPGYAAQIPVEDRWKAALHVRTLQRRLQTPPPAMASVPAPKEVRQ